MGYMRDSDGRWHKYYDQSKGSSCGPTCVRMVVEMVCGKEIGEQEARQSVERYGLALAENDLSKTTSEVSGAFQAGAHDWGNHGARASGGGGVGVTPKSLIEPLRQLGVRDAHIESGYARTAFGKASIKRPGIAVCGWNAGWNGKNAQGAHFVVVGGKLRNGNFLIIDPIFGISEVDPAEAALKYTPTDENGVQYRAAFYNNLTILTSHA